MAQAEPKILSLLRRAVDLRPGEGWALASAFGYFFCLLSGYYVLRPLREEMGVASGVENLQWLFTGTFVVMLAAVPAFGWLVARLPRRRFIPLVYHFFVLNIAGFYLLLEFEIATIWVARAFFIWVSVFNLFVISVFWSVMADLFSNAQARRLFGFIAAGGSLGALTGPSLTALLVVPLGPVNLLLISAGFLELAVVFALLLFRHRPDPAHAPAPQPIGGGLLAGLSEILRSPYLAGVAGYILLLTVTATFLYFEQAAIVAAASDDSAERTRIFAVIDLLVALLTIGIQLFLTGRLISWLGVGATLIFLPLVTLAGFLALGLSPVLPVLIAVQALRRASNFAVSKPAREVLFTVVPLEAKYKAKNVIDTAVYRGGDVVGGWLYAGLSALSLGLAGIAAVAVALAGLWAALGLKLGRAQDRLAAAEKGATPS
ncbi:MAG: MFS transporter [Pseudomonadota bacterium]